MRRRSIFQAYLAFFCVFIFAPSLLFMKVLGDRYQATLVSTLSAKTAYWLSQMSDQFNREVDNLIYLLAVVSANNNNQLLHLAAQAQQLPSGSVQARSLDDQLSMITSFNRNITAVLFFHKDNGLYTFKRRMLLADDVLRKTAWYQRCLDNPGEAELAFLPGSGILAGTREKYLVVAKTPRRIDNASDIETLALVVSPTVFEPVYARITNEASGDLLLVSQEGTLLSASHTYSSGALPPGLSERLASGEAGSYLTEDENGQRVLITHQPLARAPWQLVNSTPYDTLVGSSAQDISIYAALYGLFVLMFAAFTYITYRRVILPTRALEAGMRQVEAGRFDVALQTDWRSREFNSLGAAFGRMQSRIDTLIRDIDEREARKRALEIEALQYQINPHFMKNTLGAIRLLAMIAKNENIREVTEALTHIVSGTLERTGAVATLAEEIELLTSYIRIMQVRYGEHFQLRFEVPQTLMNRGILKMLLQPIVENAIYHGLDEEQRYGELVVTAWEQEGALKVVIADNGRGMTPEQVQMVFAGQSADGEPTTKIGIHNVIDRIRLNYGDGYGLRIDSEPGRFTRVTLTLPLLEGESQS